MHLLVQAEVGHQLLQLAIILLQDPEPPYLRHTHALELILPPVEDLLADAHLASDLCCRRAVIRLAQAERNQLQSVPGTLHGTPL